MFNKLFKNNKPMIGMIHLPPLPGYIKHPGMDAVIKKALIDLNTLQKAGFDGVLIENDNDQPHQIGVSKSITASFTKVMKQVCKEAKIPVGMEIIYDMPQTIKTAHKVGADFVRLDVFVDTVLTKWGKIPSQAKELVVLKEKIGAKELVMLTDIQVKHAQMLDKKTLEQSAKEAAQYISNALIVTGDWTGHPPFINDCKKVKKAAKATPLLIGSGLDSKNIKKLFKYADGAIVGTSIKTGDYIDLVKATNLINVVKKIRSKI
ncbi:MAG: BtpA/SgcQ family protein [Candidatus Levybacteria bacterium]|nr:BtpA/SgcQ family protein [Candidatus Levybacteria bacterium]